MSFTDHQEQQFKKRIHFPPDDDKKIIHLVSIFGIDQWKLITGFIKNKTPRQCRERFRNYLSPNVKNLPWSFEEISRLMALVELYGTKWNILTSYFPGRRQTNIKIKCYSLSKNPKQIEKSEPLSKFEKHLNDFHMSVKALSIFFLI
jgi:hypothetical protein